MTKFEEFENIVEKLRSRRAVPGTESRHIPALKSHA